MNGSQVPDTSDQNPTGPYRFPVDPATYPEGRAVSGLFFHSAIPLYCGPTLEPQFLELPLETFFSELVAAAADWNLQWESGPGRGGDGVDVLLEAVPALRRPLRNDTDTGLSGDLVLIDPRPFCRSEPLFYLLPAGALRRAGLPLAQPRYGFPQTQSLAVPDVDEGAFAHAFARHIWPLLNPGKGALRLYGDREPIRVLAHDLRFWRSPMEKVLRRRARAFGRPALDDPEFRPLRKGAGTSLPADFRLARPSYGGTMWRGEQEAWEVTRELVEMADADHGLRSVIDAVRSHRVEEDFSDRWSVEREDLERKLYSKRSKVKVRFVEIEEAAPVLAADSAIEANVAWGNLMSLVNEKDRSVVLLFRRGHSRVTDVARELGYGNHSPVSKALQRIAPIVREVFDL